MKSLGTTGLLKEWFERALIVALRDEHPVLTRKILEQTTLPNIYLKRILEEIKLGETLLQDVEDKALAMELGFKITPTLHGGHTAGSATKKNDESVGGGKKSVRKGRVGIRKQSRDPVGGNHHAT